MELPPDHRYSESDDSSSSLAGDHHRGVQYSSEAYSSMRRRHPSHGRPTDYGSLANNRVCKSSRLTCQPATSSTDREKPVLEGLWPDIHRIQAGRAGYRRCGLFLNDRASFHLILINFCQLWVPTFKITDWHDVYLFHREYDGDRRQTWIVLRKIIS